MADVSALFASRKKKGKKKKQTNNFNVILEEVQKDDMKQESVAVEDFDEDGNPIIVDVPLPVARKPGNLTASVNASKKKKEVALDPEALVTGEWVDNDASEVQDAKATLLGGKTGVIDLENLPSSQPEPVKSATTLAEEEENKKLFHWTRKQAMEQSDKGPEVPKEEPKSQVYRPRHIMESRHKQEGAHSLKELNNEQVFPTLGGGKATSKPQKSTKTPWGTVKEDILLDIVVKQTDGVYLDTDFIACDSFDGQKPGYSFKLGALGLGYYWECKPFSKQTDEKADETDADQAEEVEDSTDKQENAKPESVPVRQPTQRELEEERQKKLAEEEKERKRKEKKKQKEKEKQEWERQNALAMAREKEEKEKAERASESTSAAPVVSNAGAPEPPPPEDRFSGLKKKKKKKKPAAE
uniref:Uncharacterized protein n=1 Tax=Mucochytrium quahogii TaxID=96639 RepID=A0A7S2W1J6_9STRA|mmetsp:Transcript_10688/g.23134  ORF Transcript_10688/g.23134 Transcript_10688/m.23134 type:complete len:412 (+) Transcript_10688:98-1333(+)